MSSPNPRSNEVKKMRFKHTISLLLSIGLLMTVSPALAQDSTTGAVRGIVKDKDTGEPVAGATVVATSPALQGTQANITDADGVYRLPNLPPGVYTVTVYHLDAQFSRKNVLVQLGKTAVANVGISLDAGSGEVIEVEGSAPIIDQASTKTGATITQDYTDNIPTGRTYGAVLGAAAGSQGDSYGVSFGGSTSAENTYIVDGVNTTDPGFGLLSSNLPNEFIRETEVITGGYKAEYGRSTGGIVNVITKQGSNEFSGSVYGYWTPGALQAERKRIARSGSSIDRVNELDNTFDFGAEVGGPIIKDKLWFHVGINPSFTTTNVKRSIRSQIDEDQDGVPDVDENGFTKFSDPLATRTLKDRSSRYYYTAKLTGAVNPDHQGSVSVSGNPSQRDFVGAVTGEDTAGQSKLDASIMDISTKWTSKFFNGNTQFDVLVGAHLDETNVSPTFEEGHNPQIRYETFRPITDFSNYESMIPDACLDGTATDPYPGIANCDVRNYRVGGVGYLEDTKASRIVGKLDFTQRAKLFGHHTIKSGLDIEQQGYDTVRRYTGGEWFRQRANGVWTIRSYYGLDDQANENSQACGSFDADGDGRPDASCSPIDQLPASTSTRNVSAYIQDDWAIIPNLVFNLGLRWEQQEVFVADEIAGTTSPVTGEPIPERAFALKNMLAPRFGVIYDPTQEGRSRIFGSWGRFFESMPMDINVRAFGGEISQQRALFANGCTTEPGMASGEGGCSDDPDDQIFSRFLGSGEELRTPNLKAQYLDEMVLGGEYEVFPDIKLGASYIRRDLGRAIEDVSNDGANTYVIANPGEVDQRGINDLRNEAAFIRQNMGNPEVQQRFNCAASSDPTQCMMSRADFREFQAGQFERAGEFDSPNRTYNALQITAEKRFSDNFFVLASYTYSKLRGNFPGLFSPETGQLDPNLTSMYDLPDLMANRYGDLAADTPHIFKLDGAYRLIAGDVGTFTFGGSFRASSGMPHNTLAAHSVYGNGESYLLPRGSVVELADGRTVGRSPFTTRMDAKISYGRPIGKGMFIEGFVDIFNLINTQKQVDLDENYTFDDANPIVGGDSEDLKHAKALSRQVNRDFAVSDKQLLEQNPNYGNTSSRQAPLNMRFGLRLRF